MNRKTFYWYPHHGTEEMWVIPKPEDCHNEGEQETPPQQAANQASTSDDSSIPLICGVNLTTFNTMDNDSD